MVTSGLELRALTKIYPGFQLGPLSCRFRPGHAYGLVGPNGAGKTTLLNLIALQAIATGGEMQSNGTRVAWGDTGWKERLSYVRETPSFYGELTVAATLRLASRLYRTWDARFAATLLGRFELPPEKHVKHLSKGNAVKLGIVTALAHRADLLILDEPTSGLDPTARSEMHEALRGLQREHPELVLLFSSHILEDLDQVVDELFILRNGTFVFEGPMRELGALAVFKAPEATRVPASPDVRLAWRKDGHAWVAVRRGSGLGTMLLEAGWVEDRSSLTLATLYERTAHTC